MSEAKQTQPACQPFWRRRDVWVVALALPHLPDPAGELAGRWGLEALPDLRPLVHSRSTAWPLRRAHSPR